MARRKLKVLLIIEQCNPEWASVPLVGYCFYNAISHLVDTTLVTHSRNQAALSKAHPDRDIHYITESRLIQQYYKIAERLSTVKGHRVWPIYNVLAYPIYAEFNQAVYRQFRHLVELGKYDIVHALTPMMPRYPVKLVQSCQAAPQATPFVLGPVNGGFDFPPGFQEVARREFSYFNFLRTVGRWLIPGYRATYAQADQIFAGSTHTLGLIKDLFNVSEQRLSLFYENGIHSSFLKTEADVTQRLKRSVNAKVQLLFVGRLVPCKSVDMILDALGRLSPAMKKQIMLTIVGDGPERSALEQKVMTLNLHEQVQFTGWVDQQQTLHYYANSDIFCLPSVREFGGAVVMEAMANGLPCIVVNYGGIGEYVTDATGFRIDPFSRNFVVQQLTACIEQLMQNPELRAQMSYNAIRQAQKYTWPVKAKKVVETYYQLSGESMTALVLR